MLATIALLFAAQSKPVVQTFDVGGVKRQAMIVSPSRGTGPAPLVFVFHGHGGNMRQARISFHIDTLWPEAVVVYPDGLPTKGITDPKGAKQGWQQQAGDEGGRDLKFFDAMLSSLERAYRIDKSRIYVTGHSNGGRFTYLLWAERGQTFAAVAPSASPAVLLARSFTPLPAFIVAGEQDRIVPFGTQKATIEAVRKRLGTDAAKATKAGYLSTEPGRGGLELATFIFPGGHRVPQECLPLIVDFFKRHAKR